MSNNSKESGDLGRLDIYPEIVDGSIVTVSIVGDPDGLRSLASLLLKLADVNQNITTSPDGSRFHMHLHPEDQLGCHSCEVELCRADAKGTGELPAYMNY